MFIFNSSLWWRKHQNDSRVVLSGTKCGSSPSLKSAFHFKLSFLFRLKERRSGQSLFSSVRQSECAMPLQMLWRRKGPLTQHYLMAFQLFNRTKKGPFNEKSKNILSFLVFFLFLNVYSEQIVSEFNIIYYFLIFLRFFFFRNFWGRKLPQLNSKQVLTTEISKTRNRNPPWGGGRGGIIQSKKSQIICL